MPRYDYECESCHHEFELKQSFSSEPVANCPRCEGVARRQFHSVPVVFKGSGWYVNDYGKRGGYSGSSAESKDSDGEDSKTGDKAESAAKSESESKSTPESKAEPKAAAKTATKDKAAPANTSKND